MPASLLQYRSFIWRQARADLRHRYAGTGMGFAWNIIHPLAMITVYSLVFTNLFNTPGKPNQGQLAYTIYLCSGFFPWLAFSDCLIRGCSAFLTNASYLRKLPIPEQVFVAQIAAGSLLSLSINFGLLLGVSLFLGWPPGWTWLLLPIPFVMLQSLGFGVGLLLGTLNVFFRDIAEWVNAVMMLLMWTVPIVYKLTILPKWFAKLLPWHPLMPALEIIRDLFMDRTLPPAHNWVGLVTWPVAVAAFAFAVLAKLRPEIRDVI